MDAKVAKVAFIHFGKAAGRYVHRYLSSQVFRNPEGDLARQEYKEYNSWQRPFLLSRDWFETELLQLANNRFPGQLPTPEQVRIHHGLWSHDYLARQYVHNHHYSWSRASVCEFRRNGWFTFMFIREPADLLCSLWTWSRKMVAAGVNPDRVLQPTRLIGMPLDGFLQEVIGNADYNRFYALPDYVEEIDYVAEFTEENFRRLLSERFEHDYRTGSNLQRYRRPSGNPGYAAYRNRGDISDRTHSLIERNAAVQRVREHLGVAAGAMLR